MRRPIVLALLAVAALAGCRQNGMPAETVVIVSIDTARYDHFSVYGYPIPTTPNLEALAEDGVVFDQAIAVHTNTAPSHASILTGLYPPTHESINNGVPISSTVPTLGEILSDHGFATAAFVSGKTLKAEFCGLDRGFSVYEDRFDDWERRADATLSLAQHWLQQQDLQQRVFLFFHVFDPHFLYSPPIEFLSFGLDGRPAPPEPIGAAELRMAIHRDTEIWRQSVDEWTRRYDGEIAYTDRVVGDLMDALKESGRYSKALVVVVSDHGETLAERPRVFDHGARVTEEQIRVPLIVKFPDRELAGRRVAQQVSQIDIAPTVLHQYDLPDVPVTAGIDLRVLTETNETPARPLFIMARREPGRLTDLGFKVPEQGRWDSPESMLAAVRLPPHKLIDYAFLVDSDLRRLRQITDDPDEDGFVEDPAIQSKLERLLDEWWLSTWTQKNSSPSTLDDRTATMLQALGYMELPSEADSSSDRSDIFIDGFEGGGSTEWSSWDTKNTPRDR